MFAALRSTPQLVQTTPVLATATDMATQYLLPQCFLDFDPRSKLFRIVTLYLELTVLDPVCSN